MRFEKEHINSLSEDGELMLTLLASFAQEESRSISENVKWGVRKRFQSGEIGAANKHILGYRYDDGLRKYVIIPEEAEAARWMFQMYIEIQFFDGQTKQWEMPPNFSGKDTRNVCGKESRY